MSGEKPIALIRRKDRAADGSASARASCLDAYCASSASALPACPEDRVGGSRSGEAAAPAAAGDARGEEGRRGRAGEQGSRRAREDGDGDGDNGWESGQHLCFHSPVCLYHRHKILK